jgi:hypothetical protein
MRRALERGMLPPAARPGSARKSRVLAAALVALALVAAAEPAAAQFTAAVTLPRRRPAAPRVLADGTRADSVRTTVLSDLKAWVDSAATVLGSTPAGARPAPSASRDSAGAPATPRDSAAAPAARPSQPPRRPRPPGR